MKDKETLHKQVQEQIDCFAATDPLKEMSELPRDQDAAVAATKWLALTALHGINMNAKKISIRKSADGNVEVTAKYRPARLPSPGTTVGQKIIDAVREITYLDEEKGKTLLALGIRDSSVDLKVKVKKDDTGETVTIKFPE